MSEAIGIPSSSPPCNNQSEAWVLDHWNLFDIGLWSLSRDWCLGIDYI